MPDDPGVMTGKIPGIPDQVILDDIREPIGPPGKEEHGEDEECGQEHQRQGDKAQRECGTQKAELSQYGWHDSCKYTDGDGIGKHMPTEMATP